MSGDRKRYIVPDPIDPDGYRCIKVYVPSDTMYIGAFWNAYSFLATWAAWEKDPTHKAAAAAAVWKTGFDLARAEYEAGEECTVEFELRDDPDDPCKVQQSLDGGTTWIHAFTKDGCADAIVDDPPFPDDANGDSSAAGNLIENTVINVLALNPDCASSRAAYIADALAYLRVFDPAYSNASALGHLYDAFCGATDSERAEALDPCRYAPLHAELKGCYNIDGVLQAIDCALEKWIDFFRDGIGAIDHALYEVFGGLAPDSLQTLSGDVSGTGGGGGFAAQCDWCHEFDFTTDDYDTFPHGVMIMQDDTVYSAGIGYQNAGGGQLGLQFQFDAVYEMSYLEFDFTSDGTFHHDSERARIGDQHTVVAGQPDNPWSEVDYQHKVHSGGGFLGRGYEPRSSGFVQILCWSWSDAFGLTWPQMTVTHAKICGVGTDPFV